MDVICKEWIHKETIRILFLISGQLYLAKMTTLRSVLRIPDFMLFIAKQRYNNEQVEWCTKSISKWKNYNHENSSKKSRGTCYRRNNFSLLLNKHKHVTKENPHIWVQFKSVFQKMSNQNQWFDYLNTLSNRKSLQAYLYDSAM